MKMNRLTGKVAVVTGANSGIGNNAGIAYTAAKTAVVDNGRTI